MSMEGGLNGDDVDVRLAKPSIRYHALDWARVTAMFLGVFYHLPISIMGGGFGMGFGFNASPKTPIDNWLHSFRMPLFFLISGFFASMMLAKYGPARYMARRWWRIGAPLFLAVLAFAGYRYATDPFRQAGPPAFGPPPGMAFAPLAAPNAAPPASPAGGFGARGATPFGGPPGGFGAPGVPFGPPPAGRVSAPAPPFGMPPAGPGTTAPAPPGSFGPPGGGFGPAPSGPPAEAGAAAPGTPPGPGFFPPFEMPPTPSRSLADRLFGSSSRYFNLEHLWFLWYLLVFSTIAPMVAMGLSRILAGRGLDVVDRIGRGLVRYNGLAPVLGLITLPALIHARGFMGWTLANPVGFLAPFPDFLFQYYPDTPFYFLYFLAGWWLYRLRGGLDNLGRGWLWNLALGIAGFAASQALFNTYGFRRDMPNFEGIRVAGYALYGLGAAFTSAGFLGGFQRYLDRPTRIGRYFADTILWVYLIHLPLIPYLLWWIQPGRGPWWADTLAGMTVVAGVSLVLFELIVRPTPLDHVFGPPRPRRTRIETAVEAEVITAGTEAV